jgi:hypothetical protein
MRFGIEFGSYPADLDSAGVCRQISQKAQVAYKCNFEALFVAQHYVTGPDARYCSRFLCWPISPARLP